MKHAVICTGLNKALLHGIGARMLRKSLRSDTVHTRKDDAAVRAYGFSGPK